MSIALPVHRPGPTFTIGSTIAGHLISKDTVHLLHNKHRTLGLYEIDISGSLKKTQEFLTKGTTSIHLVAAQNKDCLDAFVMVGDLVDWYSVQEKGANSIHDFVCLESKEQLMQFCRTVPYTFVQFDAVSGEFVETRRFYFAEDSMPTVLTHSLPDGTEIRIIGTSSGLIGTLSLRDTTHDRYYKVGGCQNTTYKYASLSKDHLVVEVVLNDQTCYYFLRLDPFGSLTLVNTYRPERLSLGVGPIPFKESSIACVWYTDKVEFVDATCSVGPICLRTLHLPLSLGSVRHAPHLSECEVEAYLTSSHLIRVHSMEQMEILEAPRTGAQIGGGGLYFNDNDLVQLRKYTDVSSAGWMVSTTRDVYRSEFPYAYEFATVSGRGCESSKKEFSSWSHCFDPNLGSSFLTTKDASTYAVCRKSGLCANKIEDVIQLWQYDNGIIASTQTETMAFYYEGTPRLDLKQRPLLKAMDTTRTFAFKDGTQVTGTHINSVVTGESFPIPSHCQPVVDATCVDQSLVVVASDFSTFAISNGLVVRENRFEEPVMKVIAAGGIIATMTLQQVNIEDKNKSLSIQFDERLSDVVVVNSHVVSSTFDGSVYLDSERLTKVNMVCSPVKLIVAGYKVLAVTEIDAVIIDTLTLSHYSALALSGVNGGFSWDNETFAVLKNGNMWVCDLNAIGINLQRTSQIFIGPIKADVHSAPQWSWSEKLACTNAINSVRFNHEITDVCPVHPLQQDYLRAFDGLIAAIEPKAYISSFETLYLWADFKDYDLFRRLTNIQKRLETRDHTFGGHHNPKWLEWMGFVDGELLEVALQNHNLDWLFEDEGVNADKLRATLRLVSY